MPHRPDPETYAALVCHTGLADPNPNPSPNPRLADRVPDRSAAHTPRLGQIAEARRVQKEGMVVVTSGDWDYREIVLNWVRAGLGLGLGSSTGCVQG